MGKHVLLTLCAVMVLGGCSADLTGPAALDTALPEAVVAAADTVAVADPGAPVPVPGQPPRMHRSAPPGFPTALWIALQGAARYSNYAVAW